MKKLLISCGQAGIALAAILPIASVRAEDYQVLYEFSAREGWPRSALVAASDGKLYGTTVLGGANGLGSVYTLTPDGSGGFTYAEIFAASSQSDGEYFQSSLVEGPDGLLYGVSSFGGDQGHGVVFRVDGGGTYEKLASFGDFAGLPTGLILASDGSFYGMMSGAGSDGLFRFDETGLATVHEFTFDEGVGSLGPLLQAANGDFYGAAQSGGAFNAGTIFRVTLAGVVTVLHTFTGTDDGGHCRSGLIQDDDGNIYGTTPDGGAFGNGTIFRIDNSDAFSTVHAFGPSALEGGAPHAALWKGSDGNLYGTTTAGAASGLGALFRRAPDGTVSVVHAFDPSDGVDAQGSLIESTPGHLLGPQSSGGSGGYGTVLACDFGGLASVVHAFAGEEEGFSPAGGVVEALDGTLYGTAQTGGAGAAGTVFRLAPNGTIRTLHAFHGDDGSQPSASLAWGPDGRLYGTAYYGDGVARGSAFAIDPLGNFQLLHAFTGGLDDGWVSAGLLPASDGNLYGVATHGGSFRLTPDGDYTPFGTAEGGSGTLIESDGGLYGAAAYPVDYPTGYTFRLEFDGSETTLHEFFMPNDPFEPRAGLVKASDGNFYGTTIGGGLYGNGTVYRMTRDGTTTRVHDFLFDGAFPSASLIQATDGFLYGTTVGWSGLEGSATVFRIDFSGTGFSTVHAFPGGIGSTASLIQASDGSLVGTTFGGGAHSGGVVFRLGLPPSPLGVSGIEPAVGNDYGGAPVTIAGAGFVAGATAKIGSATATAPNVTAPTQLLALSPPLPAGTLNDVTVTNPDASSATLAGAYLVDFLDVPSGDIFHSGVEWVFRHSITAGCGGGYYCRDNPVTRAQMAVFLIKAIESPTYAPPPATGTVFDDVPAGSFAADWIEDLASRGITGGCGGGSYCPAASVSRAQMSVLLLKARLGVGYAPPDPTGTRFDDVPADAFAAAWIEDLAGRGITAGCSGAPPLYCPDASVSRGQMAVFLQRTFATP